MFGHAASEELEDVAGLVGKATEIRHEVELLVERSVWLGSFDELDLDAALAEKDAPVDESQRRKDQRES